MIYDYLVVGSGFFGSVFAQQAKEAGKTVIVIEKRDHIGGNCHSYSFEDTGIIVHSYGTHIFHTNNKNIWDYVNRFGAFNQYQHRVLTQFQGKTYSMPINLKTVNDFYNVNLKPHQVDAFLEEKKGRYDKPRNLEEKAINLIGKDLYEAFIKGYTIKQWQKDPKELPPSIITRLPVRNNYNDLYFNDPYQGLPVEGYTPLFGKMLEGIPTELGVDYFENQEYWRKKCRKLIYTGPIDLFFGYQFGRLCWRSVDFEIEKKNLPDFQGTSVMNYADAAIPYTRIHEPKHLHPEREMTQDHTVIIREFPSMDNDSPYYPVNTEEDTVLYKKYKHLADTEKNVCFGGRLAQYKYFDMHHVIACALALAKREFQ